MDATNPVLTPPACTVIDLFPLGDKTCTLLAFHRPEDNGLVNGYTMRLRGTANEASMSEKDFWYFWNHRKQVPEKYWKFTFTFPNNGVRYVYRDNDGWRHSSLGLATKWYDGAVIVRLS